MTEEELVHLTGHDSAKQPVEGCKYCDKEINRPIQRCFGNGKSTSVIPMSKENRVWK